VFLAKPKGGSVEKEEYLVIPTICFVHVCHFVYHRGAQRKRVQERGKAFHTWWRRKEDKGKWVKARARCVTLCIQLARNRVCCKTMALTTNSVDYRRTTFSFQ